MSNKLLSIVQYIMILKLLKFVCYVALSICENDKQITFDSVKNLKHITGHIQNNSNN